MFIGDAVHCAIEDVNQKFNKKLKSIYSAPVLASDFTGRTARVLMRNLRTRYDGSKSPTDLVQLFNRHSYCDRPLHQASGVNRAKAMMMEEAGRTIPQAFTEFNYSTGGNWAKPSKTMTNDSPEVFTSLASTWGCMMKEQGVQALFCNHSRRRRITICIYPLRPPSEERKNGLLLRKTIIWHCSLGRNGKTLLSCIFHLSSKR